MQKPTTLAVMVCYDTAEATRETLAKFPTRRDYDVLAVSDGSTDATEAYLRASPFNVVVHQENRGLGAAIKSGVRFALDRGYKNVVILAGNGKDDPVEIPRLLEPIEANRADYVQGSRFREGGSFENLPAARHLLIRLHALGMYLLTGQRLTDSINGFRAYRLSVLDHPRIDIWQDWLDRYEYESYLHFKVLTLGYRVVEVPVSKRYPAPGLRRKYSHIRPVIDWWSILRPLLLLSLRLRR